MQAIKHLSTSIIVTALLSCTSQANLEDVKNKSSISTKQAADKPSPKNKILETWVSDSKSHIQIVEVKDSSNATVYRFHHWTNSYDTGKNEKFSYYKSDGKIDNWDQYSMSIQTPRYHFYYQRGKDTLFELAEPGRVDTLIRVYNDSTIER